MDIKLYVKRHAGADITVMPEGVYQTIVIGDTAHQIAVRIAPEPPKDRTLADILRNVVQHGVDYPGHGTNCACLDRFIREIGNQVRQAIPDQPEEGQNDFKARATHRDALSRIRWVLMTAVRGL